jgi:hypothetical protein
MDLTNEIFEEFPRKTSYDWREDVGGAISVMRDYEKKIRVISECRDVRQSDGEEE